MEAKQRIRRRYRMEEAIAEAVEAKSPGSGIVRLQRAAGNRAVTSLIVRHTAAGLAQRDGDPDPGTGDAHDDSGLPAGAPPVINENVEESPADAQQLSADDGSSTAVAQDAGAAATAPACQQLTWDDFPGVDDASQDYDAQTGFSWSMRNNQFSAAFDASSSWVKNRWKRDTSAASVALLRHEQYHLSLVCLLVSKANTAVAGGASGRTVTSQLRTAIAQYEASYEDETNHGQNAGPQNTWVSNIDSGAIAFPHS
jgi:hypothetical protein